MDVCCSCLHDLRHLRDLLNSHNLQALLQATKNILISLCWEKFTDCLCLKVHKQISCIKVHAPSTISFCIAHLGHGMDRGQRPPQQNQVPPKLKVPPHIEIAEVPPLKPRSHVKGNQVPSRESNHFLLDNFHFCSVFVLLTPENR